MSAPTFTLSGVLTDPRGHAFGAVLTGDVNLASRSWEIAARYTPGCFDTMSSYVRKQPEPTPWAKESGRLGGDPLFLFLTRDAHSHRLVVPVPDGGKTLIEPAELPYWLDLVPGFRQLDAGPLNRPLVLMMDCLDLPNDEATGRTAEEILRGHLASQGYRRIYYPDGMLSVLDSQEVQILYGGFRLVREPALDDITVTVHRDGNGITFPLPGLAEMTAPVDVGDDFVIQVAGDGERLWLGTRGGRGVEIDATMFARIITGHTEVKKVLAGPASRRILLCSPYAGDRRGRSTVGDDFAAGLQLRIGPVTAR
jgi:hypothetical protein